MLGYLDNTFVSLSLFFFCSLRSKSIVHLNETTEKKKKRMKRIATCTDE